MANQANNYVAFFDLDDTIISENSGKVLIIECYKKGLMSTWQLIRAYSLAIAHKLRIKDSIRSSKSMVRWLKGVEAKMIEDFAEMVVKTKLFLIIRPWIKKEIEKHKKNGAQIVMLSASMTFITKHIGEELGFDHIICTDLEVKDGLFTGEPNGRICIDEEKENQIRKYCETNNKALETSYYYGDAYSDRFVMKAVGHPVAVHPDKRLYKIAKKLKWKIKR